MSRINFSKISGRADRDQGDLQSLTKAIAATNGKLLQPILLRKVDDTFFVIDGRRRFAVLAAMGRKFLEDGEYILLADGIDTRTAAYTANTERKSLSAMEEAQQMCNLLKQMTESEVAEKLGKTLNYVVSRSKLADLQGKWRAVLENNSDHPNWTIGKLQLIAREPAETQKNLEHLITDQRNRTLAELVDVINYYHRRLADAPFNWQDICYACPKRSDRQGVVFEEDQTEAVCLDFECFDQRCFAECQRSLKNNPQLKAVRNGSGYGTEAGKWADKNNVPQTFTRDFKIVADPAQANGVICCGENIGKFVKITRDRAVPVQTSADSAAEKASEKAKKAEVKKQREIMRLAMQKLIDQLKFIKKWVVLTPDVTEQVWGAILSLGDRMAKNGAICFWKNL